MDVNGASQPSASDVGQRVLANTKLQAENSDVTRWLVAMFSGYADSQFGILPQFQGFPERVPIRKKNAIIQIQEEFVGTQAHEYMCNDHFRCQCQSFDFYFWDAFRRIAANPIGRCLLYRILLEIYRDDEAPDALQLLSNDKRSERVARRNKLKVLKITYSTDPFEAYFDPATCTICVSRRLAPLTFLKKYDSQRQGYQVGCAEDTIGNTITTALFHEFLHWYHSLRNFERFIRYSRGEDCQKQWRALNNHPVSQQIYNIRGIPGGSTFPWINYEGLPNYEEILTILGRGENSSSIVEFLNGDDLSENVYRISCGLPYRFGHADQFFLEDEHIIKNSIDIARKSMKNYCGGEKIAPSKLPNFEIYAQQSTFEMKPLSVAGFGSSLYQPLPY